MPIIAFPQASLATSVIATTVGGFIALSPPHENVSSIPATGDSLRRFDLTGLPFRIATFIPLGFLALHTSSLALFHPQIPTTVSRYGAQNGLSTQLITWSPATSIPLALVAFVGIPLRLVSYASLGKNFTFTIARPDALKTDGIYRYIQHPSYTGLMILVLGNSALLARVDGALSCWIPPRWFPSFKLLLQLLVPVGISIFAFGVWTRVRQEERMLRTEFGINWEKWHARTARFIPWIF